MITLAQLLEANGEDRHYAFIHDKHLVPLDPSLSEFPNSSQIASHSPIVGNSEKIWYVTKADNCEKWLVTKTNYDNLEDFVKHHKFTITIETLEKLIKSKIILEKFKSEHCDSCGTQRCDRSNTWLEGCEKWKEYKKE